MAAPPPLSRQQRSEALAQAVAARRQRAALKEDLRAGTVSIAQLLARTQDAVVGRMKVDDVLQTMRGVGRVRAARIMTRLGIAESRRLAGLGTKQVEALLKEFPQP